MRTPGISNEEILAAARAVFLEQGPAGSTVDIAKRAGVSEGLLFKRFETKDRLFLLSMGVEGRPHWIDLLDELAGKGALPANLVRLELELIAFFRELIPRMTMLWSSKCSPIEAMKSADEPPPILALKGLTRFLEREAKDGRLRAGSAPIAARVLLASAQSYAFFEMIGLRSAGSPRKGAASVTLPADVFAKGLVEMLWQGIAPGPAGAKKKGRG